MTANQLKYWELRWKQHYENILAQVKVKEQAETERHNRAVEAETARHNRVEERIDTQNMIINRLNLEARWAELDERHRAALVAEALNEKQYKLAVQAELRQYQYTQAQIQNMLAQQKVAAADFALDVISAKNKINADYLQAEAALVKAGWGKGVAAQIVAEVKSSVSSAELNNIMKAFANNSDYSWISEAFGPATLSEIGNVANKNYKSDLPKADLSKGLHLDTNKINFDERGSQAYNQQVSGFSNSQTTKGEKGVKTPSGTMYYRDHRDAGSTKSSVETKTAAGTRVIYSGGSHYGPGYAN